MPGGRLFMEKVSTCILGDMKRKKLYYVPGMISLLALPFLIFFFEARFKPQTSIRICLMNDKMTKDSMIFRFSKYNFYKSIAGKKIIQVDLRKNELSRDSILYVRLDLIKREIERLKSTGDTTSVIEVILGDSNT